MQSSGLARATLGLSGKGETVPSLTSNAAPLSMTGAVQRFAAWGGSVVIDDQIFDEVTQANFSYSKGLDNDETIRADSEMNSIDAVMPAVSLALTTKFTDLNHYNQIGE